MSKPVIVVVSPDQSMASGLPGLFQGRADIRACHSFDELIELGRHVEPNALVADFRRLESGGHAEDRLLETVRARFPRLCVAMVTSEECPEPLARHAAIHDITLCRGHLDRARLLKAFRCLFLPDNESASRAVVPCIPYVSSKLHPYEFHDESLVGGLTDIGRNFETKSPQLKQMLVDLEIAARHDVTILLTGETGVGKTFLSRLIHEVSPRRHEPFLAVTSGALTANQLESELFGHVKGAFTNALADKEGKLLAARRGSIVLDEIDLLGPDQQVKLLRLIETGEFEPVGSNQTHSFQARLIVTSNFDLRPLMEQGRFRPDLYYRLNMLKFAIPPLRRRKLDIISLARKFICQFAIQHGIRVEEIDDTLFNAIMDYPWLGNVRELQQVIQRSVIYCSDGRLSAEQLPQYLLSGTVSPPNNPTVPLTLGLKNPCSPPLIPKHKTLGGQIALSEKEIIEHSLFNNSFIRNKTAKDLGISRVTLYNKMKKYGMMK